VSRHLLAIAVGPVQEFIAAARRTRDLWFGSKVLSDISKAVAKSVRVSIGKLDKLIFPAPDNDDALIPDSALNVANVILAEIPEGLDVKQIAKDAKAVAEACWAAFAKRVIDDLDIANVVRNDSTTEHGDIWNEQVGDVVEFYAAWVPLNPDTYKQDRARVMRLLAGRKNCRDFIQAKPHASLPKSSLDGMRDTVLIGPPKEENTHTYRNSWPKKTRRKLRVRAGEQLDVVGVVKRAGEGNQPYPSVSRVAADPWIRGILAAGGKSKLAALDAACEDHDIVHRIDKTAFPQYREFPLEGTTLFRTRHHEWFEETEDAPKRLDERQPIPPWYKAVDETLREVGKFAAMHNLGEEPNPYLAVIVADGDNMGATISKLETPEEHRTFSRELARFATDAAKVVSDHFGVLVYAGGDDVFAFAPVDRCLDCARELHDVFGKSMADLVAKLNAGRDVKLDANMTLSVGVAIGHFMENLEDLRKFGQDAEKHAKKPDKDNVKDALAVHLHKRGGGPIKVRAKWTDTKPKDSEWADAPDTRITGLAALLNDGQLPNRLATDLNKMVTVYEAWPKDTDEQKKRVAAAIKMDVLRVIAAKQPRQGENLRERLQSALDRITDAATLKQLAEELLVARQIATACRQANPATNGGGK